MSILATTVGGAKASADSVSVGAETLPGVIPVLEEQVVLNKDVVTTGRVRVTTQTKLADEVATATLDGQEVDVTRVKIGKPITGDLPQIRTEGDLTIVPVFEEVLVVEKHLMLKEELHIRRRATSEKVEVPVQLRKQEVAVEHVEG